MSESGRGVPPDVGALLKRGVYRRIGGVCRSVLWRRFQDAARKLRQAFQRTVAENRAHVDELAEKIRRRILVHEFAAVQRTAQDIRDLDRQTFLQQSRIDHAEAHRRRPQYESIALVQEIGGHNEISTGLLDRSLQLELR